MMLECGTELSGNYRVTGTLKYIDNFDFFCKNLVNWHWYLNFFAIQLVIVIHKDTNQEIISYN